MRVTFTIPGGVSPLDDRRGIDSRIPRPMSCAEMRRRRRPVTLGHRARLRLIYQNRRYRANSIVITATHDTMSASDHQKFNNITSQTQFAHLIGDLGFCREIPCSIEAVPEHESDR